MKRFAIALLALGTLCGCDLAFSTLGSWTTGAPAAAPLTTNSIVALADGRVAIFGGSSQQTGQASAAVTLYDPAAKVWSVGAPMPGPGYPDVVLVLRDGTVLVEGGQDATTAMSPQTWLYDPIANAWSRAGDMIEARRFPSSTV